MTELEQYLISVQLIFQHIHREDFHAQPLHGLLWVLQYVSDCCDMGFAVVKERALGGMECMIHIALPKHSCPCQHHLSVRLGK